MHVNPYHVDILAFSEPFLLPKRLPFSSETAPFVWSAPPAGNVDLSSTFLPIRLRFWPANRASLCFENKLSLIPSDLR